MVFLPFFEVISIHVNKDLGANVPLTDHGPYGSVILTSGADPFSWRTLKSVKWVRKIDESFSERLSATDYPLLLIDWTMRIAADSDDCDGR